MGNGNIINKQLALSLWEMVKEPSVTLCAIEQVLHIYCNHHSNLPSTVSAFYPIPHSVQIKFWIIIYVVVLFISIYQNNLWVCGMSSDLSGQIFGTISERMGLDNVLYIPIWNQDMRIMFALDSSCYTLLAVLPFTVWLPASYNTTSVGYNWAISRLFTKSTQHIFPMVSTGTLNSASKCFVKLICLLRISYFL